jgi:uncharacterized surface protein with fasciclin (FAS1) repeats
MKGLSCRFLFAAALMAMTCGLLDPRAGAKPSKMLDIVDTVAANKITTNFAAMIQASDLVTFLSSRGPFTIFVPADSAFSRMKPGELDLLLQPQNKERLQDILLYHIVNGKRLYAKDLITVKTLLTCESNPLTLRTSHSGTQFVLKARIVHADIRCLNGVIHQIDTLLLPPEASLPPLLPTPPPPAPPTAPAEAAPPATGDSNTPPADTNLPPSIIPVPQPPQPSAAGTNAAPSGPVILPQGTTP